MKILAAITTAMLVGLLTHSVQADTIYFVNRTIGTGTVTGFVETDGTIGALSSENINDWELTLFSSNLEGGPTDVISMETQTQTFLTGITTTATATDLLFDIDGGSGLGFFLLQGGSGNYWCIETAGVGCTGGGVGEHIGFGVQGGNAETAQRSGQFVFASVIPEPTSAGLLGAGLLLAFVRRRC